MNQFEISESTKTLRQLLSEGRLPVQDGLRYAALLADALRRIHDEGRCHGGVTPDAIALTSTGLELLPAVQGVTRVTSYTAPEVAGHNKPADSRSDIFSFGAVVFEMLTGRRPFEGENEAALVTSLCVSPAPPSGSPAVDRLLAGCLAKDPAARWQRVQKIQLEVKLLTAAARRSAPAPVRSTGVSDAALRAELAQFEARINAKLQAHEQLVTEKENAANEAFGALRNHLAGLSAQLNTLETHFVETQANMTRQPDLNPEIEALSARFESGLEGVRNQLNDLHGNVAADMRDFETTLKHQAASIESARTAMAQTDDLLERVVEALESLQSTVLEQQTDEHAMAAGAR